MNVIVLRLGHRVFRDQRITTHCALVARAFGARGIILSGEKDQKLEDNVRRTVEAWGGPFGVAYEPNWKGVITRWKRAGGVVAHLAMYGIPFEKKLKSLKGKKVLVVIGSEKVPGDVYGLADFNIAVTNQPHSEVAALAIFLHELSGGKTKKFRNARIRLVPQERGKKIVRV